MVLLLESFFVQIYKWIPRSNNSVRFPGWRRFAGFFRSLFWWFDTLEHPMSSQHRYQKYWCGTHHQAECFFYTWIPYHTITFPVILSRALVYVSKSWKCKVHMSYSFNGLSVSREGVMAHGSIGWTPEARRSAGWSSAGRNQGFTPWTDPAGAWVHRAAEGAVTHPLAWAGSLIGGLPFVLHPEISGSERIL